MPTTSELMAIAERRMRAEIEAIPDGTYTFQDAIEDDGITDRDYPIELALTIDGGNVIADFTGSAQQAVGPVNAIYAVTASAIYNAFLHLTDPTIPRNEGCYRPFTIIAPPGTIVNCSFPAPVAGGNTETSPRITDMVFGALQDAIPDRIAASCGGTSSPFLFGGIDPRTGEPYAHFHFEGVGWGGRRGARRQQHGRHDQRQLPEHAGRGIRDAIPGVPDRVLSARARLRRARRVPWWTRRRAGLHGHGSRSDCQCAPQPDEDRALGGARRARRSSRRPLGPPRRRLDWRTFVEEFGTISPSKFSGVTLRSRRSGEDPDAGRRRLRATRSGGSGHWCVAMLPEGFISGEAARESTASMRAVAELGEWMENEISYLKPNRDACDLCGHPIAIRYWGADVHGGPSSSVRPSTSSSTTTTGSRFMERRRSS